MDKKSLPLLIVLGLLIVFWGSIMDWIWPPDPSARYHGTNQAARLPEAPIPSQGAAATTKPAAPPQGSLAHLLEARTSEAPRISKIENEQVEVTLTSLGGGIDRVLLKRHSQNGSGQVVLNAESPIPILAVAVGDAPFLASYQTEAVSNQFHAVYRSAEGLEVSKRYALKSDYEIETTVTLKNQGRSALGGAALQVALGMVGPLNGRDNGEFIGFSWMSGDKAWHETVAGLQKQVEKQGKPFEKIQPIDWAALKTQFFTTLITPSEPFAAIQAEPFSLPKGSEPHAMKDPKGILAVVSSSPLQLAPGASTNWTFSMYVGPKEYRKLSAFGKGQDQLLNFGMFEIFSKALLWLMGIFHSLFNNWGVAIIGVTVVIKILFWPLTAISTKSMKQMQALAPKMNALKEKYKDDQKKLNEETMKMYREYKINPMAGCLPMLVQIPIFIAFYNMLRTAIELRGASFLWIHDLSMPDTVAHIPGLHFPINLMPLIMAVTMICQTKMTPQAPNADPSMKMMMWLMPAMFLFFCYNFSSGLSLYWTAQNLLTILQTYLTKDKPVEPPQKIKTKGGFTFGRPVETRKK